MGAIGKGIRRKEDRRFLTGKGRYTDDHNLPGQVRAIVVRSPYPHARIAGIDKGEALAAPGVIAVLDHAEQDRLALDADHSVARAGAA